MNNGVIKHGNFKIIISSETINFRNILAGKLRLEGFEVEFAVGGFHMMHILEKFTDCKMVIVNEDMHDMSAQEIIGLIRLIKSKQELPILFISKSNSEEEICDMIFAGANEYIVQSANFNPILERAHKYLQILKANAA